MTPALIHTQARWVICFSKPPSSSSAKTRGCWGIGASRYALLMAQGGYQQEWGRQPVVTSAAAGSLRRADVFINPH